jgi:hypothetical protein
MVMEAAGNSSGDRPPPCRGPRRQNRRPRPAGRPLKSGAGNYQPYLITTNRNGAGKPRPGQEPWKNPFFF